MDVHARSVVSSLSSSRASGGVRQPLTGLSVSPDAKNAAAVGKDVLHVLRLDGFERGKVDRLDEIRSIRVSQYFQNLPSTGSVDHPQYPHFRDVLHGHHAASSALPAGGSVLLTDVAWSMPQSSYVLADTDSASHSPKTGKRGSVTNDANDSPDDLAAPDSEHGNKHLLKRVYVGDESLGLDSTVVAAGSNNGVIAAWSASSLLLRSDDQSEGTGVSGLFGAAKFGAANRKSQMLSQSAIAQPEASFVAHSRSITRLNWHHTRAYLMLSASQDGTVKLWDRRATSGGNSGGPSNNTQINSKSWFGGFGNSARSSHPQTMSLARTAMWHCISTFHVSNPIRDVKWSPHRDEVFALVAGEWLCLYDIRVNKPLSKESVHAGDATSLDWHPTRPNVLATAGGRDRSVKVWDCASQLCDGGEESQANIKLNSASYRSDKSGDESLSSSAASEGFLESGSASPVKRSMSGHSMQVLRHSKNKKIPLRVLNIASPVTKIRWCAGSEDEESSHCIAVSTASIYGSDAAGGHGNVSLWSVDQPFVPLSVCEGHVEGPINSFDFVSRRRRAVEKPTAKDDAARRSPEIISSLEPPSPHMSGRQQRLKGWQVDFNFRRERNNQNDELFISVGRDGALLQTFSLGSHPLKEIPTSNFAMANFSTFQRGSGSLQIVSVNQQRGSSKELAFSVIDSGCSEDLENSISSSLISVCPEITHLSRFAEMYVTSINEEHKTKSDLCLHNGSVANKLGNVPICHMWRTLAFMLKSTETCHGDIISPMTYALLPTVRKLLLQRADAGDIQTCVVVSEIIDVIVPPPASGGSARCRISGIDLSIVQEWYLTYIDMLRSLGMFMKTTELVRNCKDPVIASLSRQSTTVSESCPKCGKVQDSAGVSAYRLCRNCRQRVGFCFVSHLPCKGMYVFCPGCGHGGCMVHANEWFSTNSVCPTGCGHRCNFLPAQYSKHCVVATSSSK